MTKLTRLTITAASGLALLLAGCAGAPAAPSPSESASSPTASQTPSPDTAPAARKAAALQAIQTSESAVKGTAFSLDWTRDRWELEVIANGRMHDIYVDSAGATIVRQSSDRAEAEDVLLLRRAKVTMAEALTTALGTSPNAALLEVDLDSRAGQPLWEVDTMTGSERQRVRVDAVSGSVI